MHMVSDLAADPEMTSFALYAAMRADVCMRVFPAFADTAETHLELLKRQARNERRNFPESGIGWQEPAHSCKCVQASGLTVCGASRLIANSTLAARANTLRSGSDPDMGARACAKASCLVHAHAGLRPYTHAVPMKSLPRSSMRPVLSRYCMHSRDT